MTETQPRPKTLPRHAVVMGFEATLHYSYAYNLEQCATLFTGLGEGSTSNLPLFSLLGSTSDFHKTNKILSSSLESQLPSPPPTGKKKRVKKKKFQISTDHTLLMLLKCLVD